MTVEPLENAEPLRLLVVEDEELDRLAVRRCLQQSGIRMLLDEARSAEETLRCLGGARYDCVLLDYYIPGVEGLALVQNVREVAPETPIVMFTGRGDEEVAVELMKAGAADYLPKASLTPERLASSLRHALEIARATAERHRAEEEVRAHEARFRTLANAIPQLAWMADATGERNWFNQRWLDYTGASPDEAKGWGWQKVHHPDHVQRVVTGIKHSFATGEPWEDTFPLLGKDGEYRWFLSRALPVRSANGTITGWLGTNTDITERKATEEERIALLEREHVAREQAEAALRTRDNFFASITHDLKNPLGAVKGYAQLLKRRLARESPSHAAWLIEGLERIESNADRTASLIEELLDLVRYREAGRLELHRTEFDLVGLCRALIDEQRRGGYRHEFELIANVPQLVGSWDRSRLERVLVNLLENAIKYSPNGGRVVLKVDRQLGPGGSYAVISISDQGVGIPAPDLPRIFEQFHRAANVAEQIGGTGIGLTSAQQIVQVHGGTLAVESREGFGSTFTITLPA